MNPRGFIIHAIATLMDQATAARIVELLGGIYTHDALALRATSREWRALIPAPKPISRKRLARRAGREGAYELLEFVTNGVCEIERCALYELAMYNAARFDHYSVCEKIYYQRKRMHIPWDSEAFRAHEEQQTALFGLLMRHFDLRNIVLMGAARGASPSLFKRYFNSVLSGDDAMPKDVYNATIERAARGAHVDIVRWMFSKYGDKTPTQEVYNAIVMGAARGNHTQLLRETLRDMRRENIQWMRAFQSAARGRAHNAMRELLEWMSQDEASVPWKCIIEFMARHGTRDLMERALAIASRVVRDEINWHEMRASAALCSDTKMREYVADMQLS